MPIPLFVTTEFLYDNLAGDGPCQRLLDELVDIFRNLNNIHNLEQCYLDLLTLSCISKANGLLSYRSNRNAS